MTTGAHRPADERCDVLVLRNVVKTHRSANVEVHALSGVDVRVNAGEFVAVMGPSGSGKSTLLHLAGGLDVATSGEVVVEGQDIGRLSVSARAVLRRRHVGYVFQDFNLIPTLTAAENVALPRELDGCKRKQARTEAIAAMEEMGIGELADRFPDEMSGGQQQRTAIARAIIGTRRLILADEPTGALDSHTGEAVLEMLRSRADKGSAVVLVTHDARYAAWADRVVFLRDGRVVDTAGIDSADDLLAATR